MRFKKGSKVEVLDKRELPSGSWWCAEIVSGNGHYYSVKYDSDSEGTCVTVERVPRKVIRPIPPSVMSPRCWVPGDIVEVYEKNSWKVAEVSRVVGASYFLVRLLGSSRELWAHISDLRMRLVWEDGKWVVVQKEFREGNNGITNTPSKAGEFGHQMHRSCVEVKACWGDDPLSNKYDASLEESCWAPLGSKKRKPCLYSQIVTRPSDKQKMRSAEDTGRKGRLMETLPSHLLDKVDVGGCPRTIHGAKLMHSSLNDRTSGFLETKMDERKLGHAFEYNSLGCLDPGATKSTCSSVGSCSASNGPYRSLTSSNPGTDSHYDDTASSSEAGRETSLHTEEGSPEEIHCLELSAYRSTIIALYSHGPLSWEQETVLTNLRLMFLVSNEEHLLELKQLANEYLFLAFPTGEMSPEEIHCLELNAYRSTIVALYSHGPLSWEQETVLTNLRLMLHISNEEHLLELKQLTNATNRYSF